MTSAAVSSIYQSINILRQQGQLNLLKDQVIIDDLAKVWGAASNASIAIIEEAALILALAKACRLNNDDHAHEIEVRITRYFDNEPQLTILKDALRTAQILLDALENRARRLLQLPSARQARKDVTQRFLDSEIAAKDFVDRLYFDFQDLSSKTGVKTGVAAKELDDIRSIMRYDSAQDRLSMEPQLIHAIAEGERQIKEFRHRRKEMRFDIILASARTTFLR
jgi:hypothetical protein